ncbi:hypothetical protein B0J13DRAFT_10279 [Dactylonectria estremocensis]|uniref:Uncharacterized protein n=1 Tax=Dactylonectria estremocensis TaxID=1079267 RepID=A0A9P9JKS3_9HYPO|nr:hypothetical protein B0J13DRAFT_10279 [Dactylonectria estremocensis]
MLTFTAHEILNGKEHATDRNKRTLCSHAYASLMMTRYAMDSSPSPAANRDDASADTKQMNDFSLPASLDGARITTLPQSAFYIPNFISEEEEQMILAKIATAPKPRWKQLTHRRLQTWPSDLVKNKLLNAPLPPWLEAPVISRLLSLPFRQGYPGHVFDKSPHKRPNHVLINEYPPGIGIMPHKMVLRIGPLSAR